MGDRRSSRRGRRDPEAIAFAQAQRAKANEFAQDVWQIVRNRRCRKQKFRREYPIAPYTVDFCCVALKLIIEVDGEHHQTNQGRQHDQRRDRYLAERGYEVIRIPGYKVLRDALGVRHQIERAIDQRMEQSRSPLTPVTKASKTRLRHRGEGSQSELRDPRRSRGTFREARGPSKKQGEPRRSISSLSCLSSCGPLFWFAWFPNSLGERGWE